MPAMASSHAPSHTCMQNQQLMKWNSLHALCADNKHSSLSLLSANLKYTINLHQAKEINFNISILLQDKSKFILEMLVLCYMLDSSGPVQSIMQM